MLSTLVILDIISISSDTRSRSPASPKKVPSNSPARKLINFAYFYISFLHVTISFMLNLIRTWDDERMGGDHK